MKEQFARTGLLLGEDALIRLKQCRVAVFGIGGVGGYTVEALVRSGIGAIDLCDADLVAESNLNRQIIALRSNIGQAKTRVAAERIREINPECSVTQHCLFYLPETRDRFDFTQYDYVVDAIDTVTGKLSLIEQARDAGVPVISCMGAGNKLDPTAFRVADIYETSVCPLAKVMRRECRKRGIDRLKVVYSTEEALVPGEKDRTGTESSAEEGKEKPQHGRRSVPGSVAFVPSVAGLILAGEVIKDLIRTDPC